MSKEVKETVLPINNHHHTPEPVRDALQVPPAQVPTDAAPLPVLQPSQMRAPQYEAIPFTPAERILVEETYSVYSNTIAIIARLKGIPTARLQQAQVSPDRTVLLVPQI